MSNSFNLSHRLNINIQPRHNVINGGLFRDDQYSAITSAVYLDQTEATFTRQYECFAAKQQTVRQPYICSSYEMFSLEVNKVEEFLKVSNGHFCGEVNKFETKIYVI